MMSDVLPLLLPSPLVQLQDELLTQKKIALYMKRDDLIHPYISGNKWRKLKYYITDYYHSGKAGILTYGGPYSNHLTALASLGNLLHIATFGIIRGEKPLGLNPTIAQLLKDNMHIHFVDRNSYSNFLFQRDIPSLASTQDLYIIPEGGAGPLGEKGASEIVHEINTPFDYIITSAGTGTTAKGLFTSLSAHQKLLVISPFKNYNFYDNDRYSPFDPRIQVCNEYHFNGFGKKDSALEYFIHSFQKKHEIPLDYVYTGKMMYGIMDLIAKDYFAPHSRLIAYHSGGVINAAIRE